MKLRGMSPKGRALIDAVQDAAAEEHYELIEADEDGDTITLTFSRDVGLDTSDTLDDEDDDV